MQEVPNLLEEFDKFDMPIAYTNKEKRKQYPLPIRANIIFIATTLFTIEVEQEQKREGEVYKKKIEKNFSCTLEDLLRGLILQEIKEPVFDLTRHPIEYRLSDSLWLP